MTEWPARRSGDRILCGRMVDGRHVCQGEIAGMMRGASGMRPFLRGFVEASPGHWEPSRTAREKMARGQRPAHKALPVNAAGEKVRPIQAPEPPWSRDCPHCGCVAVVQSGVLK